MSAADRLRELADSEPWGTNFLRSQAKQGGEVGRYAELIALAPELARELACAVEWIARHIDGNGCSAGCEFIHGYQDEHDADCEAARALLARLAALTGNEQ